MICYAFDSSDALNILQFIGSNICCWLWKSLNHYPRTTTLFWNFLFQWKGCSDPYYPPGGTMQEIHTERTPLYRKSYRSLTAAQKLKSSLHSENCRVSTIVMKQVSSPTFRTIFSYSNSDFEHSSRLTVISMISDKTNYFVTLYILYTVG